MICPVCDKREIAVKLIFTNGTMLICCTICAKEMRKKQDVKFEERAN